MSDPRPVAWLLTGLPGSGKTTFATALARGAVVRLSVDDRMTALHGRIGKDHAASDHLALQAPVIEDVRRQFAALLGEGRSVVLDHGLGTRAVRDDYKGLVTECGGRWRLVHFQVAHDELLRRLAKRNGEPEHGVISRETLAWIAEHSEAPVGEGEEPPVLPGSA
ncbi:AAA family ATPase [Streptomyces sp. NBC_01257]|uniref:AAA family ATPase n=1 Tax=Streptomyces sp. NBC_01257 TaxID=2903799 RepID=UPI002DDC7DFC|nr:ATP-binding protein [Streptomyces sp. NBC_01257]WRZ62785.1 ATP-binding protein [Streptomyces sp. NBC_01257]